MLSKDGKGWLCMLHSTGIVIAYINKLLLFLFRHLSQTVVFAWEIAFKSRQSLDGHSLHLTSFSTGAGRGQAEATDTAASAYTGWQHIFVIKNPRGDLHQTAILCITVRIQNSLSKMREEYLLPWNYQDLLGASWSWGHSHCVSPWWLG